MREYIDSLLHIAEKDPYMKQVFDTNKLKALPPIQAAESFFTKGACINFAATAQTVLGHHWEMYGFHVGKEEYSVKEHYALKHPDKNLFFDFKGLRTSREIIEDYKAEGDEYIWIGDCHIDPPFELEEEAVLAFVQKAIAENIPEPENVLNHEADLAL